MITAEQKTHNEKKAKAQSDSKIYVMAGLGLTGAGLTGASEMALAAVGVSAAPLGLIVLSVMLPISVIFTAVKTLQHCGKAIGAFSG